MTDAPAVILSGFADETCSDKDLEKQFTAFAALGLEYYSIRFVNLGDGVKNVMKLTTDEIAQIRRMEAEYDLNVASIGSPIGKVKLLDVEDGTSNRFVPFDKYLTDEVEHACKLAHLFETKLIRGFSFYHPRGTDPEDHLEQTIDQLGRIAEKCHRDDLTFGLEVEANLVGQNGHLLRRIWEGVSHPAMMLIFDSANLVCQGYSSEEVYDQYEAMRPGLGWMHIKDYRRPRAATRGGHVDEESLRNFVPADLGDGAHERILRDFKTRIPELSRELNDRGIPGVFLDLEPHVRGGGQFGGFSGPDGFGVALRGLCRVLDYVQIDYRLRDFEDLLASRDRVADGD
jgi:sugar phosphate isomerase/epimerase